MNIPCVVLIYDQLDIIKASLDSLARLSDRLELHIVENPSPHSPAIREYVRTLHAAHYLFEKNISNNAVETILKHEIVTNENPYVLVTDGDLTAQPTFLDESLSIIENENVFSVSVALDLSNLPVIAFPEATTWYPPATQHDNYDVGYTGMHLTLMRTHDVRNFLGTQKRFYDVNLHHFSKPRHWARTKLHQARHITWDTYRDRNHPYTQMKTNTPFQALWNHDEYAGYVKL